MLEDHNIGLYDLLVGGFSHVGMPEDPDQEGFEGYFDTFAPSDRIRLSILENLTRVFQTQAGMVPHLEYFGVPADIWKIYSKPNEGPVSVEEYIRKLIERYEPRLRVYRVYVEKEDKGGVQNNLLSLMVRIEAQIMGDEEKTIVTEFSPAGFVQVVFDQENE